jgi:protocatechuate 3,4-dioxygenase beta subunit
LLAVAPYGMRGIVLVSRLMDSVTIEAGPTASIHGRILDEQGQPLANATVRYGIRKGQSHRDWAPAFDGRAGTDKDGFFTAQDLVPGYEYWLMAVTQVDHMGRPHLLRFVGNTRPETPGMVELGDLKG